MTSLVLLCLVMQGSTVAQETGEARARRPNVILVMSDDQGWGDVGYRGHPVLKTPNLDDMARRGLRFDRWYAGAPVCSPTRGSCLTGRHPYRYGIRSANRGHVREQETTLAEALRSHGYGTGHFGKWHLGTLTKKGRDSNRGGARNPQHYAPPWEHGFDECFSTEAKVPTWDPMVTPARVAGGVGRKKRGEPYGTSYWTGPEQKATENLAGDDSRVIMDRAIPFIERTVAAGKPFFAVIWFHAPHLPVVAGPEHRKPYAGEPGRAPDYFGCIAALDQQVGRLRGKLRELGVADDTMLWFCSDNGPEGRRGQAPGSTAGLRGRKRSLYEGGIRVPGILEWPRQIKDARTVAVPCSTSDYFPTVLDALGVEPDATRPRDGVSLMPLIAGKMKERPRPIAFESGRQVCLIENRWKLIRVGRRRDAGPGAFQLFDLVADPAESKDLVDEQPEIAARMRKTLDEWRASCRKSAAGEDHAAGGRKPRQPNILFIMADDLGPEWIGCCGGEGIETPHIDALAASGTRFTNAYSMPKCTPTRVTLLTGQYPFRHGWVNHWDVPRWGAGCHFDPKHNTSFARLLREAGYATAIAGKWQINDFRVQPEVLRAHGFDAWCMWTGFETGNRPSAERYWDPYVHDTDGSRTREGRFGTDVFVDYLIDFMKRHRDEPMLLYFPMALPHGPLTTTPLAPEAEGKMPRYKAMVRYVDHAVGRLTKALDELELRDRTIVIFTTDNGSGRGVTGSLNGRKVRGGKGRMKESGCRAPFLVSCPGLVPAGRVTGALTDFTDMLPTFVELAGAKLPEGLVLDGHSIAPVLLGKAEGSRRQWIMAMGGGVARLEDGRVVPARPSADRVLRDKRWKLWIEGGEPTRLFDLVEDPGETNNLIESDTPEIIRARDKLAKAARTFPAEDARPRYDSTPPQPWDRKPRK